MKKALFTNWTNEEFTGFWDGKDRNYPAGSSQELPDYLANHYAKHLTNRELLRTKEDGKTLVYKDGDKMTSPKFPEQIPLFMELFNKAYKEIDGEIIGDAKDDIDSLVGQFRNPESQEEPKFPINKKSK